MIKTKRLQIKKYFKALKQHKTTKLTIRHRVKIKNFN